MSLEGSAPHKTPELPALSTETIAVYRNAIADPQAIENAQPNISEAVLRIANNLLDGNPSEDDESLFLAMSPLISELVCQTTDAFLNEQDAEDERVAAMRGKLLGVVREVENSFQSHPPAECIKKVVGVIGWRLIETPPEADVLALTKDLAKVLGCDAEGGFHDICDEILKTLDGSPDE